MPPYDRTALTRARLSLDQFQVVHAHILATASPWAARAIELALITGQRREDIARLTFRDIHDGCLWVRQEKTGAQVCIPLELRLHAVGWSVGEIVARCRDRVVAKTLVHHVTHTGRAKPGDAVRAATLSAEFRAAREALGVGGGQSHTPPSFHEIRSLAARLYADQGVDAQALLGHKSPQMTALYRDSRGTEWVRVNAV